jgi:hypothetical protein
MKKTNATNADKKPDELRPEYRFDYQTAKPNRFSGRGKENRVVVVLDSDVAQVFPDSEAVNEFLRALIQAMPPKAKQPTETKSP